MACCDCVDRVSDSVAYILCVACLFIGFNAGVFWCDFLISI